MANIETKAYADGTTATGATAPCEHPPGWISCRVCGAVSDDGPYTPVKSADECPQCGTEEWDRVTAERGRERDVPFNRCARCNNEWAAS